MDFHWYVGMQNHISTWKAMA